MKCVLLTTSCFSDGAYQQLKQGIYNNPLLSLTPILVSEKYSSVLYMYNHWLYAVYTIIIIDKYLCSGKS